MNKIAVALVLVLLILVSIIAGALFVALTWDDEDLGKLYAFPVSVGEETYIVTVETNSSDVSVYLGEFFESEIPGIDKSVNIDLWGENKENYFFNVTIPADLIWGELSVIAKYYKMDSDQYTMSNNGTHHSVKVTFNLYGYYAHYEVRGTEGATPEGPSS